MELDDTDPNFEMQQICQLLLNKEHGPEKLKFTQRFENVFRQKLAQAGIKSRRKSIYEEVTQQLDEFEEIKNKVGSILPDVTHSNIKYAV